MKSKIIKLEMFKAKISNKTNWVFLKLINDQNLTGWGELTLQGKENELFKIKDIIFSKIINIEYKTPYELKKLLPYKNIIESAISSSIMQALWDVQGKLENKTIGSLFGSKNDKVEIYANFNRSTIDRTIPGIISKSIQVKDDQYQFIKFAPFDEVEPSMSKKAFNSALDLGLERINAIKDTLGKKVKVLIDCHWRFNFGNALQLIKECEAFDLYWIECPLIENLENLNDIKVLRSKANHLGIKLAGLEKGILREGFFQYLKNGSYDVMMPDIKYAGGPDEMLDIHKVFRKYSVEFSPHNPSGPISHAHTLQVCSAINEKILMEYQFKESPFFETLLEKPNPKIIRGQSYIPNHCAGAGVTINEKALSLVVK